MHRPRTALSAGLVVLVASAGLAETARASAPPTESVSCPRLARPRTRDHTDDGPRLRRPAGGAAARARARPRARPAEVDDRLALDAATATVERTLSGELGAVYAGTWVDAEAGTPVVAVTDPAAVADVEAAGATALVVDRSRAELDDVAAQLETTRTPDAVQAWYVDVTTNEVVVESLDPRPRRRSSRRRDRRVRRAHRGRRRAVRAGGRRAGRGPLHLPGPRRVVRVGVLDRLRRPGRVRHGGALRRGGQGGAHRELGADGHGPGRVVPGHDYAWARVDARFSPVPRVNDYAGGTVDVAGSTEAPVGASVCRSGATTGWRCGVIEQKNITVNYGTGTVSGLARGSACAEGGDSGGSVVSGDQAQGVTSGRVKTAPTAARSSTSPST